MAFKSPKQLNQISAHILTGVMCIALLYTLAKPWLWSDGQALTQHTVQPLAADALVFKPFDLDQLKTSLMLHNPWEHPAPVEPADEEPEDDIVPTELNYNLVGTVDLKDQGRWAILKHRSSSKQLTLALGDEVEGAKLERIEREAIYLRNRGRLEVLDMKPELKDAHAQPLMAKHTTQLNISRNELDSLMGRGVSVVKGIKIHPYYDNGKAIGYRLTTKSKTALLKRFGIQSGDVLYKINGVHVVEPNIVMPLAKNIRANPKLQIDFFRKGKPKRVTVSINE